MKRFLLSIVSAERLEKIGLWLIIIGLIGEAALVFSWLTTDFEKPLTFVFTLMIALGVWLEDVGASEILKEKDVQIAEANARTAEAELQLEKIRAEFRPRDINPIEFLRIIEGKPKMPVDVLYVRDDADAFQLAIGISSCLRQANWDVTWASPILPEKFETTSIGPSAMAPGGQPKGVTVVGHISLCPENFPAHWDDDTNWNHTPFTALTRALGVAMGGSIQSSAARKYPRDKLRVVVGPRR